MPLGAEKMPDRPTSGSETHTDSERSIQHLSDIFTEVTGVEQFVETQDQLQTSERVVDDSDPRTYVAAMIDDTGLTETLSEPDHEQA
jgi:hypothetical protein